MMKMACKHCTRTGAGIRNRVATVLLLAVALLTTLGWTEESWGQAKAARVGILASQLTGTTDEETRQSYASFQIGRAHV